MNSVLLQESHVINTVDSAESLSENGDYSKFAKAQRIALYVFFFSINFEVWDPFNTDGFFSISKLAGYIYLITIIPRIAYFIRTDTIKPFILPAWLFFGLLTLVNFFNINHMFGIFFNLTIFQNIFLFWLLINHERNEPLVLEKGMLSFALGSIAFALLFIAGVGIEYYFGRITVFGDNSNWIGLRMGISLTILAMAIAQNRLKLGRLRYLLLLPMPIMFQLIVETASRVALISFIFTFVTSITLFRTINIWGKIAWFAGGSVASIYGWIVIQRSDIFIRRLYETYYEGRLAGREEIWTDLLPLIENNPIFGAGETGYNFFAERTFGINIGPHNVFLEVICYTGIVGLIIYLIFLYRIYKSAYENFKIGNQLLSLLLLVLLFGIFLSGQILDKKIGWCIFAYVAGSSLFKPRSGPVGGGDMFSTHDNSLHRR